MLAPTLPFVGRSKAAPPHPSVSQTPPSPPLPEPSPAPTSSPGGGPAPAPAGSRGEPWTGGLPPSWEGRTPQLLAPPPGPVPGLVWAGFWPRLGGCLLDWVMVLVLGGALVVLVGGADEVQHVISGSQGPLVVTTWSLNGRGYLAVGLAALGYFAVAWASAGRTLGQATVRVTVLRLADGQRPRPWQAVVRALWFSGPWLLGAASSGLWLVGMLAAVVGLGVAAVEPRRRGWHDLTAQTVAVRPWP